MNKPYGMKDDVFTITRENCERAREYGKSVGLSGALARTLDILLGQDVEPENTPEYYHVGQKFERGRHEWLLAISNIPKRIIFVCLNHPEDYWQNNFVDVFDVNKITKQEFGKLIRGAGLLEIKLIEEK